MYAFGEVFSKENRETEGTYSWETRHKSGGGAVFSEISSQDISEITYKNTIENVTKEFGEFIPEEQRVRIDIESEINKPTVMSAEAYMKRFPEADPSVLGHCDSNGRIFLKDVSSETVSHVTTHEALHLTSYKEVDDINPNCEVYRSGIREVVFDKNGEISENNNQALNEGITELYAIREMELRGETSSIKAFLAYPEARTKASELRDIVGSEVIQKAYFGGNSELLKSEVNRLSYGDETAWDTYSKNVDILEYGTNADEVRKARQALTIQNAIMTSFLETEGYEKNAAEV